jgi:hypothetical protein
MALISLLIQSFKWSSQTKYIMSEAKYIPRLSHDMKLTVGEQLPTICEALISVVSRESSSLDPADSDDDSADPDNPSQNLKKTEKARWTPDEVMITAT